jgi:NACalpha-BTF3-like transcription factor
MKSWLFCFVALTLYGCDELSQRQKEQPRAEQSSAAPNQAVEISKDRRFVLPAESNPFLASSVALDTITGQLCKTYAWQDNARLPKGLPICSELGAPSQDSLTGATKAYRGSTYNFNGTKWVKGNKALMFNTKTQGMDPLSDDQYDPLKLYSKEEKAKRTLTEEQIRKVAEQFNVSYEEALEDAKQQGYQVPTVRKP